MSLFESIRSMIQICQLSGLTPFALNPTTSKWEPNASLNILSIILMLFIGILFSIVIIFNSTFNDYSRALVRVITFIVYISINYLHALFMLLELFCKRNEQINLWNKFETLNMLLCKHLNTHLNYEQLKNSCNKLIIVWLCEIAIMFVTAVLFYIHNRDQYSALFFVMYAPPYILCRLSDAYLHMLLTLAQENLDVLNRYFRTATKPNGYYICALLRNRKDFKGNHRNDNTINFNVQRMMFMKKIYSQIWETFLTVENLMHWSFPIGLFSEFFIILFNSYFFVVNILLHTRNTTIYIFLSVQVLSVLGRLLFLASISSNASKKVTDTIDI